MRRILACTDLSDLSAAAFRPAARLAQRFDAEVTLLYVIDALEYNATFPYPNVAQHRAEIERAARRKLEWRARQLMELGAPRVKWTYRVGTPYREVLTEIETEGDYDLLVLATHGWSGFRRLLVGSLTETLVRHAPCPVLAVHSPQEEVPFEPRRILAASDLSEGADAGLRYAGSLAGAFDADLEVVHVFRDPIPFGGLLDVPPLLSADPERLAELRERFTAELARQVERLELPVAVRCTVVDDSQPARAIADLARHGDFDLVVVSSHGRRGLENLVLGSVTERLVRISEVPVLVVRPGEFSIRLPTLEVQR